jgi:pimeloyl-ACP methyl ester carboxylesterase
LESTDAGEKRRMAARLAEYRGAVDPVIARLKYRTYNRVEPGYHPEVSFSIPALRKKHPDDLLYFSIPKSYSQKQATGLIVFLHGGGNTSSRRAPRVFLDYPDDGTAESDSNQLGNLFNATGMIAVGPSAPWDEDSSYRWCLRESDEYLADVIRECQARFHIDPDRVFLLGHSMGGFGAYHHALRQPDRFASVIVNAGSWSLGFLPAVRGTPLCIVQGVNDARKGVRWHYTDVEYARYTDQLLKAYKLEHTYYEHSGKHAVSEGKEYIAKYLAATKDLRRDPYYPHITLATPAGFSRNYSSSLSHNRWLTINETTPGKLAYDELLTNGSDDFDDWRLSHRVNERPGAMVDAVNRGSNRFTVTTTNVRHCTLWLHPRMVDVTKPVTIQLNGQPAFPVRAESSLAVAIESYERRGDWGLIYPIKVEISVR